MRKRSTGVCSPTSTSTRTATSSTRSVSCCPRKLIPAVIEKSGIDPREKVNTITKKQRASLLRVLKCFPVEISGKRPIAEAIVTTGGVSVREVSPKTMESKKCSGLYFAGEVLDVDAYTGGFNLQIAWSTGRLAGLSAAQEEEQA